jgi:hypothetical protein
LRKLLAMPTSPAVVLLHAYAWFKPEPTVGVFYSNAERDLNELAGYYGLPVVSVKGCCFQAMQQGVPGFQVQAEAVQLQYVGLGVQISCKQIAQVD